jgi:hypothetical protein
MTVIDELRSAAHLVPSAEALALMTDQHVGCMLAMLAGEISEECWYAGWMTGTEHHLWEVSQCAGPSVTAGHGTIDRPQIDALARLRARLAGGWVGYHRDLGLVLLTAEEWADGAWTSGF